jgi:hypothetical protein
MSARYRVDQSGRAGRAALVTDVSTNAVVMRIEGPDRFETAERVAAALNLSKTETPAVPPSGEPWRYVD